MVKLKSIKEFQNQEFELKRKQMEEIKGGDEPITDGSEFNNYDWAQSYFFKLSGPAIKPTDRQRCAREDNPMLPGYGENNGIFLCVVVETYN